VIPGRIYPLVRHLRGGSDARCAAKNAEAVTKTGASAICADLANNDTNMKTETIKPSCRRMKDGWAPALEYDNGGVVIAAIRCGTMNEALREASGMLGCMSDYPDAFTSNHPAPNQLIDLANEYSADTAGLRHEKSMNTPQDPRRSERRHAMSDTHDVIISGFALSRLEAELSLVTEQRDRLAEALLNLCYGIIHDKSHDMPEYLSKAKQALAAVEGGTP
jgi:hypothetical protein